MNDPVTDTWAASFLQVTDFLFFVFLSIARESSFGLNKDGIVMAIIKRIQK